MNKKAIKVTAIAASAALAAGAVAAYLVFGCSEKYDKVKAYTVNSDTLRVGILSDGQLPANGKDGSTQIIALKKSLEAMKANCVDVLIMAGDFTDLGTKEAWQSFSDTYNSVFGEAKPIPVFAMGNHDYWLDLFVKSHEIATPAKMQKRFTEYTGEYPYSHKVINGFHFIVWSSGNGSYDLSYSSDKWIRQQLDAAVKDDPGKPIFVVTHLNPQDTVYGSDDWGNKDIYNVLKDYPQVISFSGHSHYALCDERSIWQGDFTAINTQTTDYIELESGKYNGTIPVDAYGNSASLHPMGMIMNVASGSVTVQRINSVSGESVKAPWTINAPFGDKSAFTYTNEKRRAENAAPVLPENVNAAITEEKDKNGNAIKVLSFDAASDDDFVHSYKAEFLDKNNKPLSFTETKYDGSEKDGAGNVTELLYFSDFTMGIDNMSPRSALRLPPNTPKETAFIRITAVDSWGAESNQVCFEMR